MFCFVFFLVFYFSTITIGIFCFLFFCLLLVVYILNHCFFTILVVVSFSCFYSRMQVFFFSFLVSVAILVSISTVFPQLDNLSQNHTTAHSNSFYSAHSSKSRSRSHALFLQAMHFSRLHYQTHYLEPLSVQYFANFKM